METTIDYFGRNWDDSTRLRYVFEQCFDMGKLEPLFPYGLRKITLNNLIGIVLNTELSMQEKALTLGYSEASKLGRAINTIFSNWPNLLKPQVRELVLTCDAAGLIKDTSLNTLSPLQFIVDIFNIIQFNDLIDNFDFYRDKSLTSQDELLILVLGYVGYIEFINIPYRSLGTHWLWLDTIPKVLITGPKSSLYASRLIDIPAKYLLNYNTRGLKTYLHLRENLRVKKCSRCNIIKPYTDFYKNSTFSVRHKEYAQYCKCCDSVLKAERQEHIINADYSKEWNDSVDRVYSMRKDGQHVDHIIPLRGKLVSGLHIGSNLQLLSAEANIRKSNKHDPLTYRHILPDGTDVFGR